MYFIPIQQWVEMSSLYLDGKAGVWYEGLLGGGVLDWMGWVFKSSMYAISKALWMGWVLQNQTGLMKSVNHIRWWTIQEDCD